MRCYLIPLCLLLLLSAGCGPKHYTATATIQVIENVSDPIRLEDTKFTGRPPMDPLDLQVSILNSEKMLQLVATDLASSAQHEAFVSPYNKELTSNTIESILGKHRSIEAVELSQLIHIRYAHPDPAIAAAVANMFAEAVVDYNQTLEIDSAMKAIEDLRLRAEQQKDRVETLELKIAQMREQNVTDTEAYRELMRELDVQQTFLQALVSRMTQEIAGGGWGAPSIRIVDKAIEPLL